LDGEDDESITSFGKDGFGGFGGDLHYLGERV
jgi:hypothetical protein